MKQEEKKELRTQKQSGIVYNTMLVFKWLSILIGIGIITHLITLFSVYDPSMLKYSKTTAGLITFNIIVFLLYRLFQSVTYSDIFTRKNHKRIIYIGYLILFKISFSMVYSFFTRYHELSQWFSKPFYFDFIGLFIDKLNSFIFLLIIFAIAEVFRQGVLLKEDNDLQI